MFLYLFEFMKKIICILFCVIALVSCDYTVHFRECEFENRGKSVFVLWGNSPYNGELWSDDEKSMCFLCEKGFVKSMIMYHGNGNVAFTYEENRVPKCYDMNGNIITQKEFEEKYEERFESIFEYEIEPHAK